jgi:hypothetical protein
MSALSFVEASVVVVLYHKHNPEALGEEGPFAQLFVINGIAQNLRFYSGAVGSWAFESWD